MDPLIHLPFLLALRHPRIKPSPIARLWVLQIVFLRFWRNKGGLEYGRRVSADLCSRPVGLPVSPNPPAVGMRPVTSTKMLELDQKDEERHRVV